MMDEIAAESTSPTNSWRLGILYTGGTIGSVGSPLKPMSQSDFRDAWQKHVQPIISSRHPDCDMSFLPWEETLDSTDLQPKDWHTIVILLLETYADYDAFLILHGTDTMAFTASALSFLLTGIDDEEHIDAVLNKPVVITGAQLPLFSRTTKQNVPAFHLLFNTDALQNVCGAVDAAASGLPEVCVAFSHLLLRGNRAIKTSASNFEGFDSPNYPRLGTFEPQFSLKVRHVRPLPPNHEVSLGNPAARHRLKSRLDILETDLADARVIQFSAYPATYWAGGSVIAEMLRASLSKGVKGLILESYGSGNFPSGCPGSPKEGEVFSVLESATNSGVVLIDCTQVQHGAVAESTYAAGSWLTEAGAVGGADMTPDAAFAKLVVLTALYPSIPKKVRRLMRRNLAGEILDLDRLDSRGEPFLAPGASITALDGSARLENHRLRGPVLYALEDGKSKEIWSLGLTSSTDIHMPGRLVLLEDGNLVFDDSSNTRRFASGTAKAGERAATSLILEGVTGHHGIRLYLHDYGHNDVLKVLFQQ